MTPVSAAERLLPACSFIIHTMISRTVVSTAASQTEGPGFSSTISPGSPRASSHADSGVRSTGNSDSPTGVNVSVLDWCPVQDG